MNTGYRAFVHCRRHLSISLERREITDIKTEGVLGDSRSLNSLSTVPFAAFTGELKACLGHRGRDIPEWRDVLVPRI